MTGNISNSFVEAETLNQGGPHEFFSARSGTRFDI